jgi:hypothetical protein
MMRKQLRTLKQLAELQAASSARQPPPSRNLTPDELTARTTKPFN